MTTNTARKYAQIFGIRLNSTSKKEVLIAVRNKIRQKGVIGSRLPPFYIVTPNPEIVSVASSDRVLAGILNNAFFSIPDGTGLSQSVKFLDLPNPRFKPFRLLVLLFEGLMVWLATWFNPGWLYEGLPVVKGRELFESLVALANKKGWKVVLLGDMKESAQRAAAALGRSYKRVKLVAISAPILDSDGKPLDEEGKELEKEMIREINKVRPQLLFIGFGAPKQEKWLARKLTSLDVGGAMVVGGAFDYVSGRAKLPPKILSNLGLEWLWRLLKEPWRARRILNAFPIFPLKVFWYKLNLK